MGIGRIAGKKGGEKLGARECRKGPKGRGNTTIIDRTCVCFFGASERKAPTAKSKEKERNKKRSVKITHTQNPFFYTTQNIHFPSLTAAKIKAPTPRIIEAMITSKERTGSKAARAMGESSAGGRQ